jgi:hypothetical protein
MYERSKVKLPAVKPDGTRTTKHPLVWGLIEAAEFGITAADVARQMKVTPQTLHIWKGRAQADRNFLLPGEQIPALSVALGIAPYYFRPDLWPVGTWRF